MVKRKRKVQPIHNQDFKNHWPQLTNKVIALIDKQM
jgi:hypothetical protein